MAQQRQPFRFRLPWLAAPQQAPAAPRPSQTTQTQTQQEPAAPRPSQGAQSSSQPALTVSRPSQQAQAPTQQAPAGLRPNQTTQAPTKTAPAAPLLREEAQATSQQAGSLAQRAPFRPAGVAPVQPTPSARAAPSTSQGTSLLPLRSRETQPPKDSPASPSQNASQIQVTSQPTSPASPSQASSKAQQAPKAATQSPSPSHGGTQATKPKVTTAQPTTPPQANLTASIKKPEAIATEVSRNSEERKKRETSKPPLEVTKPLPKTAPPSEKVVDLLKEQKRQTAFEEPREKASTKFTSKVSSPKQKLEPQSVKEVYTYKEPKQIPKDSHDKPKKEAMTNKEVQGSQAQTKAHPLEDELGQHSEEEVNDVKEFFQNNENGGSNSERETRGHEKGTRFPQKQAVAGQKVSFQKEIKEILPKFAHKNGAQRDKHVLHEKPVSIVNLTGENIGASMRLSSDSPNEKTHIHIHRGYKINSDEGAEKATGDEESSRKRKSGDAKLQEDLVTKSYVNNNVQGLNNSIVFNSSVTERNPGVHIVHYRIPIEPIKQGKEKKIFETHKAEVASTPAESVTYAPTIRRRCLRGLLMESSDSDPEKPRRHGCQVGCTQKSKDGTINLL